MKTLMKEALKELLEAEMTEFLGRVPTSGGGGRQGYRSGHYERGRLTRVGQLELLVPRVRTGSPDGMV